jgi:hypothetical protein
MYGASLFLFELLFSIEAPLFLVAYATVVAPSLTQLRDLFTVQSRRRYDHAITSSQEDMLHKLADKVDLW